VAALTTTRRVAPPTARGGWWHQYVCPAHGTELLSVELLSGQFPAAGGPCQHGCRVDTPAVRGAWLVLSHQAWARRIRFLAHSGDAASRAEAVTLLGEYAEIYATLDDDHDGAQPWMLRGRLFQQALTEAIWATSIGHAAWTLAGSDDVTVALPLLDSLTEAVRQARGVLVEQGRFESNYVAWLDAAGATTSAAAARIRGLSTSDEWIGGELGIYQHIRAAILPDGWEWEGSTYYHGFCLRAYLLALRGVDPPDIPADIVEQLKAMVAVLAGIAAPDGTLPALHDGPYARVPLAAEWLELIALAGQLFAPTGLEAASAHVLGQAGDNHDGLERLLGGWFAGPPLAGPRPARLFTDVGYAVVRAPGIHALLDFGPHGGSHGHHDKLALYLYGNDPWQPDPGQVPYGHREWRAHYRSAAAHPTFRVDGAEPAECAGELCEATETAVTAAVSGAYDNVQARRRVSAGASYLLDSLTVTADRVRTISLGIRPDVPLTVRVEGEMVRTDWAKSLTGWHIASVPAAPMVSAGPGPADDPQRIRNRVDWTAEAERVTYWSVYQAAGARPAVTAVRRDGAGLAIEFADGTVARC